MKIDFLIGDNLYGTTLHFARSMAAGLQKQGVETRLFWVDEGNFFHAFYTILDDPPDLTCSFSDITVQGKSLGELWTIPHLSLLVDPPIYFLHQWNQRANWISCVDELDCAFVKAQGHESVFFLPHGTDSMHLTQVDNERPYNYVFFGTCIDYENVAARWSKEDRSVLYEASERVLSANGCSIAQALIECNVTSYNLPRMHAEVDRYTRGKDRIEMMRHLQSDRIHIWGNGPWDKYLPHCTLFPAIPFDTTLEIMKKSQVVLNSTPRFKAGMHERILYALICGAAVYTGETPYLKEQLPELFTYRFGDWDPPSFDQLQMRAEVGQKRVINHHTWEARALSLLFRMHGN